MLSCNKILAAFIAVSVLLPGCMEHKILFDFDKDVNASFLKEMPGIGSAKYIGHAVTKKATSVQVYQSSFKESYIEAANLLELTELNLESSIPSVDYRDVIRYSQDIYMLKYHFEWSSASNNSATTPEDAVVFLAVKKNRDDKVLGVMPCYWGLVDGSFNYISFDQNVTFKEKKPYPYLKLHKREKRKYGLLFMPANFPVITDPATEGSCEDKAFNIEKIVRLDANKVGGYKPLVFNIKEIFKDENALHFHYVKTISLNR